MRRALLFVGLLMMGVQGCPDDDEACSTTQDCFDQGRTLTQCIDGQCQRQCEYDLDCQYLPGSCAQDDQACKDELQTLLATKFVCEDFVCIQACPDTACPDGSSCFDGRCAYYNESFEPEKNGDFLTLRSLGWNETSRNLKNNRLVIAWSGDDDCEFSGDRDRCAGPAAEGSYFAVLESSQATARAPRELGMTCRDCSCCLECRDPFARTSTTSLCPGLNLPDINMCTAEVDPQCQSVCDSCAQCPAELDGVVNEAGLNACELTVAPKACSACLLYDQCLKDKQAENRACPGDASTYPECMGDVPSERTQADCDRCLLKECASLEDNCMVCRRAINLKATHPEEPELWRDFETTCTNLGDAACYEAPKSTLRTDLTFDEQAMESPSIDLSATQSQSLVLQFEFIAYDLKDTFIRVIQGRPESEWPKEKERVMVQFCAANCELSENWQNGSFAGTTEESFIPADTERRNGILYTQQNRADWTLHRRMVSIPQNMRTKDFRFRFVPVLSQGVRVGVDNIFIKEQK